jgi:hypothetical protein
MDRNSTQQPAQAVSSPASAGAQEHVKALPPTCPQAASGQSVTISRQSAEAFAETFDQLRAGRDTTALLLDTVERLLAMALDKTGDAGDRSALIYAGQVLVQEACEAIERDAKVAFACAPAVAECAAVARAAKVLQ